MTREDDGAIPWQRAKRTRDRTGVLLPEGLMGVVALLERWRQRLDAALPKFRRDLGPRQGTDQGTMHKDEGVHGAISLAGARSVLSTPTYGVVTAGPALRGHPPRPC